MYRHVTSFIFQTQCSTRSRILKKENRFIYTLNKTNILPNLGRLIIADPEVGGLTNLIIIQYSTLCLNNMLT